jgi:hypothetical protein
MLVRQEQQRKKIAAQDFRRNMTSKREDERWTQAEVKAKEEDEYWEKVREDGKKGAQKNQSLIAYDILTLQYAENEAGEQQKYHDDLSKISLRILTSLMSHSPR